LKGLTDIPGILVGHASDFDGLTGCTTILCEAGAVGGVDIRGSATGTQELDLLNPLHLTPKIHGIVLAGGSAFGLEAASGVRNFLEKKGVGFDTRAAKVPLVPGAILYDLGIGKSTVRPTREMGSASAASATNAAVQEGNVGAGTGATVGKMFGMARAMKAGIGSATVPLSGRHDGVLVSALAAVNAFGDILDPGSGRIIAGARTAEKSRGFVGTARALQHGDDPKAAPVPSNTTLIVVATNAALTKVEATKLAQLSQHGMVRSISPVHTTVDGDVIFTLSLGERRSDINALGVAAAEAVSGAIVRAAQSAKTLGGIPGLAG
jgi:L-aminopeptidase/D-esterase-like protein